MRLWSINPRYLDRQGFIANWREALLAQKVLYGETKGYRNHSQLIRFKELDNPRQAIAAYLDGLWQESKNRGYNFDYQKIRAEPIQMTVAVSYGQLFFEIDWLKKKLERRNPELIPCLPCGDHIEAHPLFKVTSGKIADWERSLN